MLFHRSWRDYAFGALIIHYWLMLNTAHWYTTVDQTLAVFSFRYWLLVVPVVVFAGVIAATLRMGSLRRDVAWLLAFTIMVALGGFAKGDPYEAFSLVLLGLTAVAIMQARLRVTATLLNVLYLASVGWCIVLTTVGVNEYGFLPGGAPSASMGIGWRVSLFPYAVVGSALFSLTVIIANLTDHAGRFRRIVLPLALYFALFSANRTVIVCLMLLGAFAVLKHYAGFEGRAVYRWFIPAGLAAFLIAFGLLPVLALRLWGADTWFTAFMFRGQAAEIADFDINRLIIWRTHLQVFLDNPLLGGSARELPIVFRREVISTGSESFLTRVAAQTGLVVVLLLLSFRSSARQAIDAGNVRAFATLLVLAVLSISYGSFIVPYDMIFLSMISFIAAPAPQRRLPDLASPGRVLRPAPVGDDSRHARAGTLTQNV